MIFEILTMIEWIFFPISEMSHRCCNINRVPWRPKTITILLYAACHRHRRRLVWTVLAAKYRLREMPVRESDLLASGNAADGPPFKWIE
jgi:hypothetical protein